MSTFKRDRNSKIEINFTSSFIAGGTQYTNFSDSIVAAYRFEEPFAITAENVESLTAKDYSGNERHATITTGSLAGTTKCFPVRTAEHTPHAFNKSKLPASKTTAQEKLLSPNSTSGYQLRVLNFSSGTSERIEFPESFSEKLNEASLREPISYEDKIFKSGATFAFWIKLDGNDEIYVGPSQSNPGYQIKNPYKNRTIFSSDRTDYDIDDDASDISNCIHFGKSFAIRVINDQESQNHRKISIVSTHIRVGIKKQFEWIVDRPLVVNEWTHVCIIYPFTYIPSSFGGGGGGSSSFNIEPKVLINGDDYSVTLMPIDAKNKITLTVANLDSLDDDGGETGSDEPNKFIDIYIESPDGNQSAKKTSLLRLNTAHVETPPQDVFPSATLTLDTDWNIEDNHLSTFSIKDSRGNTANFVIDLFSTGTVQRYLNGNDSQLSPQHVNPLRENLPVAEINYNPNLSIYNSVINPREGSFIRLTTSNKTTRIFLFEQDVPDDPYVEDGINYFTIPTEFEVAAATDRPLPNSVAPDDYTLASSVNQDINAISFLTPNGPKTGIDGVSLAVGNKILVKNEIDASKNGTYEVDDVGSAGSPWILIRDSAFNSPSEMIRGAVVSVMSGESNGGKKFIHLTKDAKLPRFSGSPVGTGITLGTTEIEFLESLPNPRTNAFAVIKPIGASTFPVNEMRIFASKDDTAYVGFRFNETTSSPLEDSAQLYSIGVQGVAPDNVNQVAARIFDAIHLAVSNGHLDVSIGRITSYDIDVEDLRDEMRAAVLESGVIPLYLTYLGSPQSPKYTEVDAEVYREGSIVYSNVDMKDYFDNKVGGKFILGNESVNRLNFNTGSLSRGFAVGSEVFFDNTQVSQEIKNYSRFPFADVNGDVKNAFCRDGDVVETLLAGSPVFIFGDGSSKLDTNTDNILLELNEGQNFVSKRFIRTTEPITSDAIVRFGIVPARPLGNLTNEISNKLVNSPAGSGKGIHVQVSGDGKNWYSADSLLEEARRGEEVLYLKRTDLGDELVRSYVTNTAQPANESYSKIEYEDFVENASTECDSEPTIEIRQYAFFCNHANITDETIGIEGAKDTKSYYIRIIQEGYDKSYTDNWAIINLSVEGNMTHAVTPQFVAGANEFVTLVNIEDNPESTWQNFVNAVNNYPVGFDGEITTELSSQDSTVKLTYQSPVGILEENVSASGSNVSAGARFPGESTTTNYGFSAGLINQNIKTLKFDGGGTSLDHNTHIRIGLDAASLPSARSRISKVIALSRYAYCESKILSASHVMNVVDGTSAVLIFNQDTDQKPTVINAPLRTDGTESTDWSIDGFCDLSLAKSIGFFGLDFAPVSFESHAAAIISKTINSFSQSFGVKVFATGSTPTPYLLLEHTSNNESQCSVLVFKAAGSQPASRNHTSITSGSDYFAGGNYQNYLLSPEGSIVNFGPSFLGTSPRELEYYEEKGIPGFLDIEETLALDSDNASLVGGKTPKCLIDDFVVWTRCLDPKEVKAIVNGSRGAYELKSGLSSFDPRVQLIEKDNEPNTYPTNSRVTDRDFKGRFAINYNSDNEIVFKSAYATASLKFYKNSLRNSEITLEDWMGNTETFLFIFKKDTEVPGKQTVYVGDSLTETLKNFVKKINFLNSNENFGIESKLVEGATVQCWQTGVGTDEGQVTGNTAIETVNISSTVASIPSAFRDGGFNSITEMPMKVSLSHPLIDSMINAGHARSTFSLNASPDPSPDFRLNRLENAESIRPFIEDAQFGSFGMSIHEDADRNFLDENAVGFKGDFWVTGKNTPGIQKTGPTWSKHKIEIDVNPIEKTSLFKHTSYGATTAYYNFNSNVWEPIGTFATGSYLSEDPGLTNENGKIRLVVSSTIFSNTSDNLLKTRLLFALEDAHLKKVLFYGADSSTVGTGNNYVRLSSSSYGVKVHDYLSADLFEDAVMSIYSASNAAFLAGDLNIRPNAPILATSSLYAIDFEQIDYGEEGNTHVDFKSGTLVHPTSGPTPIELINAMRFVAPLATITFGTPLDHFVGGSRIQSSMPAVFGKQKNYNLRSGEGNNVADFRRWLDTLCVGFGPSIGLKVLDKNSADVSIKLNTTPDENKYVFADGGVANPISTFGFPIHPKFHATSSQAFNVNNVIDRPFLIEKIAYQFRANIFASATIQSGVGYGSESDYMTPAFISTPTPTFFILNQRKCSLPDSLESSISALSFTDENEVLQSLFSYTSSIPSNVLLTSMSSGPGNSTFVDTTRDLVTFARLSTIPENLNTNDFESFVPDFRKNMDLVLVPKNSGDSRDNEYYVQDDNPNASFTIAAPVRAPRKSSAVSSFKTESDFFGSTKTTYQFEALQQTFGETITQYSDPLIIEDAAGTVRRFIFKNAGCSTFTTDSNVFFVNPAVLHQKTASLEDSAGNVVNFEMRTDFIPENPVRIDSSLYYVGLKDIDFSLSNTDRYNSVAAAFCEAVNLSFDNEDLDIQALKVGNSFTLTQRTAGIQGNTAIVVEWEILLGPHPDLEFVNGSDVEETTISYIPYKDDDENAIATHSTWVIPVLSNLASVSGSQTYASLFYSALSLANRVPTEYGGFTVPFILQETGSAPSATFTFSQGIGGQRGFKDILTTASDEVFRDTFTEAVLDENCERYAALELITEGSIQKDSLLLGWEGNRTGIDSLVSGRSPMGGENNIAIVAYESKDGAGLSTVSHIVEDAIESPYLVMPGDKLVFGWQSPICTGSHLFHEDPSLTNSGSFEILPGRGKIILYGSVLQNDEEKAANSNQPLTSEAAHESIFSDADIFDIYDTDPYPFHFGSSLDNLVEGDTSLVTGDRRVISRASDGNHAIGPKDGSYPIFSKRAGFLRGHKLIDSNELIFDSMCPKIDELMSRDNVMTLNPGFDDGASNSNTGVIVLSYPTLTSSGDAYDYSNVAWSRWMASYPFEPRYDGVTRTSGLRTTIVQRTASGSNETGLRLATHVWLANASRVLRGYHDSTMTQNDYQNMLNNIESPELFISSSLPKNISVSCNKPQPYNMNFTLITNEAGESSAGNSFETIDFENKTLGTKINPDSSYFFSRLFFGSGEGTFKFPKLIYWKDISVKQGQGFGLNETFPVTRGVIIRGFKYGLTNIMPTKTNAIFRRDHFGHLRDQLEQRLFTRTSATSDTLVDNIPVTIQFRSRGTGQLVDASETNSINLSLYCTSSIPYTDGSARDRTDLTPDDRPASTVSYSII